MKADVAFHEYRKEGRLYSVTTGEQIFFIEAVNLAKRFGDVTALDKVSFAVRRGELFGFLGPNGAGKTTTINILTGLARPDAGDIRVTSFFCTRFPTCFP